jgi:hypothetical protein
MKGAGTRPGSGVGRAASGEGTGRSATAAPPVAADPGEACDRVEERLGRGGRGITPTWARPRKAGPSWCVPGPAKPKIPTNLTELLCSEKKKSRSSDAIARSI